MLNGDVVIGSKQIQGIVGVNFVISAVAEIDFAPGRRATGRRRRGRAISLSPSQDDCRIGWMLRNGDEPRE